MIGRMNIYVAFIWVGGWWGGGVARVMLLVMVENMDCIILHQNHDTAAKFYFKNLLSLDRYVKVSLSLHRPVPATFRISLALEYNSSSSTFHP